MAIELKNVVKKYGDLTAVDNVSLTFEDSTLSVLIGPSGCGKTTTLKLLNHLISLTDGDILFDGTSIKDINPIQLRRQIGYVIQEIGLFPHMTIYENIAVVPRLLKWVESKIKDRVAELLDLVNIDPDIYTYKYPAELSGGQKQRIGVARGLAADPKILLMDEPFGAIDPINREKLQDSFLEIQRDIQKTIVFVTHDIREAIKLGDKIAILDGGKLVQYDDTITLINNPKNEFVENLLGSDRALKGLELLRVQDNYDPDFFSLNLDENPTMEDIKSRMEKENRIFSFIIDNKERIQGYILKRDVERAQAGATLKEKLRTTETVRPYSTLMEAISLMVMSGITSAPVVDKKDRIVGVMRFRDIFRKVEEMAENSID